MPSTAKPMRICGRPWRSRQTLIICSAIRTGGKIRPRSVSPGRIQQALAPGLWDNLSRSPAGLGSSPTSIFTGLRPVKISECGHTRIACRFVQAPKMAQKNGGHAFLRILRFSGFLNTLGCGFYHDKLFFIHRI